ncbi:hypothetical protein EDC38_0758 [Marinimicrobium koreense]|uniref:DUF7281 domain-containing protein n=1 Tax=Marinimicrobium koreense TaxID=306545 RepID=A0A3N1P0E1_9GAMM|nr:hypothetical protein [Marinimicrobium koreense]ROQ20160.1 hypothetical protein EDC38_0758 [Marinimicrobium koreense]
MGLNRRQLQTIQRFLRERGFRAPVNQCWRTVIDQWGLGRIEGKEYCVSMEEKQALRQQCIALTGSDPVSSDMTGDRMDLAAQGLDEKLSGQSVFGSLIQVATGDSLPIELSTGTALTPPGTLLSVRPEELTLRGLSHVIVIENGAAMRHWHDIGLKELGVQNPLFIYRGHNESAFRVNAWLASLPSSVERIGFFDFDPAGVQMGFSHPALDAVIVPDLSELSSLELEELKRHCKDEVFIQQSARVSECTLSNSGQSLIRQVLKERWCLTQESMLSLKIRLRKVGRVSNTI